MAKKPKETELARVVFLVRDTSSWYDLANSEKKKKKKKGKGNVPGVPQPQAAA